MQTADKVCLIQMLLTWVESVGSYKFPFSECYLSTFTTFIILNYKSGGFGDASVFTQRNLIIKK